MEYLIGIIVVVLIFGTKAFREVKDYLLKKEQIKADAAVRAEAIRYKNQIDLEKLIQNDMQKETEQKMNSETDANSTERPSNSRIRY
jgi:hypothetical protein